MEQVVLDYKPLPLVPSFKNYSQSVVAEGKRQQRKQDKLKKLSYSSTT